MPGNNNMGQSPAPFHFGNTGQGVSLTSGAFAQQARKNDPQFNAAETHFASQGHPFPSMAAAQALGRHRMGGKRSTRRSTKKTRNSKSKRNGVKSRRNRK